MNSKLEALAEKVIADFQPELMQQMKVQAMTEAKSLMARYQNEPAKLERSIAAQQEVTVIFLNMITEKEEQGEAVPYVQYERAATKYLTYKRMKALYYITK